ncbi:hypothetical protein F5883DRAFT_566280 [Diaporthe sp. PMI_573]|nr:hypothetical protein F5883DRAFT_566280 [Diaporthaceae sp. PMI_573]
MASISGGVDARELGLSWDTTGHGLHLIFPFSLSAGDAYGHFTELFYLLLPRSLCQLVFFLLFFLGGVCLICTEKLNLILWLLSRPVISFFVCLPLSVDCGSRVLRRYIPLRSSTCRGRHISICKSVIENRVQENFPIKT